MWVKSDFLKNIGNSESNRCKK